VATSPGAFFSAEGERFIDAEGRHVILHGVSVIDKSKAHNYLGSETAEDFAAMRDWGFNCIRLGIIWDGLEPEPGQYNEAYLKGVDQRIAWARKNGLYVFLDMHQDLFSVKFSDGAPVWATLDEGRPHPPGAAVWSDAYFTSQAVQTAFDSFWRNAPAVDGMGVQDHYARAWRHVAERYADEPTVIGYDLMNEPFVGSQAVPAQLALIMKLAEVLGGKEGATALSAVELMAKWGDTAGRSEILKKLSDINTYRTVVDSAQALFQEFDRTNLMPMFQRVTGAIREVDKRHILFLETSMASNMGVYSAIEPAKGPDGGRDPFQAYAPHGYDLVTDTPDIASPSNPRVEFIFARHGETGKRLGMPMLVGEWGAYGGSPGAQPAAEFVVRQFEKLLCGETYWVYAKALDRTAAFRALQRAYPMAVAGTLLEYRADAANRKFTCTWKEDPKITAPTHVYVPEKFQITKDRVTVTPPGKGFSMEPVREGSHNTYLVIPPTGTAVERRLSVN
jgi:endoglycosylceramidase